MTFSHLADAIPCQTHESYRLNCQQYEGLLEESAEKCQICGYPANQMPQHKLYIDHWPWQWRVRGLLCIRCNSRIERGLAFSPDAARYLDNAWYLRQLAVAGVPLDGGPEPDTDIVDNFGRRWGHRWGAWRRDDNRGGAPRDWRGLNRDFGPFNLKPLM